ncbi:peptidoglycan recognition protein family protein [Fusicatenibacter sp.]
MAQKRREKMTRKQRQRQLHRRMFLTGVLVVLICVGIYSGICRVAKTAPAMSDAAADGSDTNTASDITAVDYSGSDYEDNDITDWTGAPPIDVELLTPNSWSRPQTRLKKVDGIVIHYTANPGSTAMQNRDYFENLPETQEAQASSHFVVGIEGEVVQCIPTSEWSYASNQRNFDTISIECCHPDDSGEFTDETYNSVVQLAGFLCRRFNLTSDDVIRHYDVTEKLCPLYYVEHEDAWIQMKADIQAYADSLS